jgi:transposase
MGDVITIDVDLAKAVFQIHGADEEGVVVVRRQLRRRQVLPFFEKLRPCLVGMEACATAHHWGREIERLGHRVRLMPRRYVKAYVKIQKNDAADAEAIRAHLAEFGIVAPIGRNGVEKLLQTIGGVQDGRIPAVARTCLEALAMQLHLVNRQILEADRRVLAWHRSNEASRRLDLIPGIGPLIATALAASVPNPQAFKSGRRRWQWRRGCLAASLVVDSKQRNIFTQIGDLWTALALKQPSHKC